MNHSRHSFGWQLLLSVLAVMSACEAHQAKIPKVIPPVQTYVVLDITSAGISDVDRVALNDANQAAFGTTTSSNGYTTYTFSNGVTTHAQDMAAEVVTSNADNTTTTEDHYPEYRTNIIDSQGAIYGNLYSSTVTNTPDQKQTAESDGFMICRGGNASLIGFSPFQGGCNGGMNAVGEGSFGGNINGFFTPPPGNASDYSGGGMLLSNGPTVFDPDAVGRSNPGNCQVNSTRFEPYLINNTGSAVGDINHGGSFGLWDGSKFTDITGYNVIDLNGQNQFVAQDDEGELWENSQVTVLRDTLPPLIQYQYWNIQPFSLSNQVKAFAPPPAAPAPNADATIHLIATANGLDVGSYGTMLYTRNNQGKWSFANIALPAGTNISDFVTINSSGVIAAIGNGGHALLLVPITLTNLADPAKQHNNSDTPIPFKQSDDDTNLRSVAWIAAHDPTNNNAPRMPQLQASCPVPPGCAVEWKLQVVFYDRNGKPHRDFDTGDPNDQSYSASITPDTVVIPIYGSTAPGFDNGWHKVTDGTPWNLANDPDWRQEQATNGFFGGDAVLSLRVLAADGATVLVPPNDQKFRIAGENPDEGLCKQYICGHYGGPAVPTRTPPDNTWHGFWFAYAVAREETAYEGGNRHYNQFKDNGTRTRNGSSPGNEGKPDWQDDGVEKSRPTGTGGYGIFQHTYEEGDTYYYMPRNWIWNWQANVDNYAAKFDYKYQAGQKTYNGLIATYQSKGYSDIGNQGNFSGLEALVLTYINGAGGKTQLVSVGGGKSRLSCWEPNNGTWQFLPNGQNYVDKVNIEVNK